MPHMVVFLPPEAAVVWRPGNPAARPPEKSALSGPPHVGDLHDGESRQRPADRLLIDGVAETDLCLCLQPDLLNFKKGWMVKLEGTDQVNYCCCFSTTFFVSPLCFWPTLFFCVSSSGRSSGLCSLLTACGTTRTPSLRR